MILRNNLFNILRNLPNKLKYKTKLYSTDSTHLKVLGIETSCDDTGIGIVNEKGVVLGESLYSQTKTHISFGGIIPPIARDLHLQNIDDAIKSALESANLDFKDITHVAATIKPGLALSLEVGLKKAKKLIKCHSKPFIPVHHMEAHALTARLTENVNFPYLVLLISGGHCLLAVVQNVNKFLLLGQSIDNAPGDVIDKIARRLKISGIPECDGLSGGSAIEKLAEKGDPKSLDLVHSMSQYRDCNFSFAGVHSVFINRIKIFERDYDIKGGQILPNISDLCANFQYSILHQFVRRLQRAILYCLTLKLIPEGGTLVVSGGVASNRFFRNGIDKISKHYGMSAVFPPVKYCTDNGVMIAWNGVEKIKANIDVLENADGVDFEPKTPFGIDVSSDIKNFDIKVPGLKFL